MQEKLNNLSFKKQFDKELSSLTVKVLNYYTLESYGAVSTKVEKAHSLWLRNYTIRMYKNMFLVIFKREKPKSPSTGVCMRNLW